MEKFVLGIKKRLLCIVLSVSMVCSTTAATTYQAAAIPVVYSAWEVFVTIFALLGITISCLDTIEAKQQAAKELTDELVGWKVLKNEGQGDNDGDGEDDLYATFDITKFIDQKNNLVLTEDELNDFKEFYKDNMAAPPAFKPVSSVNLKSMNFAEYKVWLAKHLELEGWETNTNFSSFASDTHNLLKSNSYSLIFYAPRGDSGTSTSRNIYCDTLALSDSLGFYEDHSTNPTDAYLYFKDSFSLERNRIGYDGYSQFVCNNNTGSSTFRSFSDMSSKNWTTYFSYNTHICKAFIVNGFLYDFDSMCSYPVNATTGRDSGTRVLLSSLITPTNNLSSNFTDTVNKVGDKDLTDLIVSDDFDIIGGDRVYDTGLSKPVGDIVIPMPSGDAITDYQNGLITYEQFLDELNVTPIDKAQGTNLLTQEFLDKQVEISNGITSLTQLVQQVLDWLANFWAQLGQMIVGVFVPSPGFFEDYFTRLDEFLTDKLGVLYLPVDLLIDILNSFISVDKTDTTLHFPGVVFQEYVIIPEQDVDLNISERFPFLQAAAHFVTSAILTFALVMQLHSKLKGVMKR